MKGAQETKQWRSGVGVGEEIERNSKTRIHEKPIQTSRTQFSIPNIVFFFVLSSCLNPFSSFRSVGGRGVVASSELLFHNHQPRATNGFGIYGPQVSYFCPSKFLLHSDFRAIDHIKYIFQHTHHQRQSQSA